MAYRDQWAIEGKSMFVDCVGGAISGSAWGLTPVIPRITFQFQGVAEENVVTPIASFP